MGNETENCTIEESTTLETVDTVKLENDKEMLQGLSKQWKISTEDRLNQLELSKSVKREL